MVPSCYSYDTRGSHSTTAKHWQDGNLDTRAYFRIKTEPSILGISNITEKDEGEYRCRIDYSRSPTKNLRVKLTVIGKLIFSLFPFGVCFFLEIFFSAAVRENRDAKKFHISSRFIIFNFFGVKSGEIAGGSSLKKWGGFALGRWLYVNFGNFFSGVLRNVEGK